MLHIHLFGKLRKLTPNKNATDDSVLDIRWHENTNIFTILKELNISFDEIGEIFVNHSCISDFESSIADESRVAIFAAGMHLLCGGQHLKGHGFIQKVHTPMSYWNDPFQNKKE